MSAIIGHTGFVGSHLDVGFDFTHRFNSSNIHQIVDLDTDVLVCAGLPAEKWKANSNPQTDWDNTLQLSENLSRVTANQAILISTIDVYQPAQGATEFDPPTPNGFEAYGRNRAWFEGFFASHFENSHIIRLPGLFGANLRKNLIYDLMHDREDQIIRVNANSKFQFFNVSKIWNYINAAMAQNFKVLNLSTEPITAQETADIFGYKLSDEGSFVEYNMKSAYFEYFQGKDGYLIGKESVKADILEFSKQR